MPRPHFAIVGAMKCGTSTLQAQLAAQPGIFMCEPKEPNFFSDDDVYARGLDWYEGLFAAAPEGALLGEASTHYTKLPTHPAALDRFAAALPDARLVYLVRDPVERLVSHYLHERSMGVITVDIETAVDRHPELVDYGRYAMQIGPWVERFGRERVHLASLERMTADPEGTLAAVARFVGHAGPVAWRTERARRNASAERLRRIPLRGLLLDNPVAAGLRRAFVPKAVRNAVRRRLQIRERPTLPRPLVERLAGVFAEDRAALVALFPEAADLLPPLSAGAPRAAAPAA